MKFFGWKSAGRDDVRPALSRYDMRFGGGAGPGTWPSSYEAQFREGYAVFENFELGDYGNRIPSLTFEVIADDAPVSLGAIAAELGEGLIDGRAITMPVPGFSAYGDSVRGVLETLAVAGGAWFAPVGAGIALRGGAEVARLIEDAGFAASERASRRTRMIAAIEIVPQTITIGHYDPARDYQTGLQRARRPGAGVRSERIEMPAALAAATAKSIAEAALARAEAAREHRQVSLGWDAIDVLPGDRIALAGEGGRWRVAGWSLEAMVVTLDLVRLPELIAEEATVASSGRVLANPDLRQGPTTLHVFELPPIDDNVLAVPRIMVAALGTETGWRRAALLYSIDDGASWTGAGPAAAPAVIGSVHMATPAGSTSLRDLDSEIEVTLIHDGIALAGANDSLLDAGANLALIGDELIQFGNAVQIAPARWRLSRLLRGRRGTDAARTRHLPDERFVLIEPDTLAPIDLPLAAIGARLRVLASGIGDVSGPAEADCRVTGISVLPASPVHLRIETSVDASPVLKWARRSRAGWRWFDGADARLVEEREAYRVTIVVAGGNSASHETSASEYALTPSESADWTMIEVRQLGSNGQSPRAVIGEA